MRKRSLILWLIIPLLLISLWSTNLRTESEEGYTFTPLKRSYELAIFDPSTNSYIPVFIYFPTGENWAALIKEHYPNYSPEEIGGLTLRSRKYNRRIYMYRIYIAPEKDGSINLDSLGHEIAHVFQWDWHP